MTGRLIAALAALTLGGCAGEAVRQTGTDPIIMGSADRGAVLVRQKCAGCHAVERTGDSPMTSAPPFHAMGVLYPVRDLHGGLTPKVWSPPTRPCRRSSCRRPRSPT